MPCVNQLGGEVGQALELAVEMARVEDQVLAANVAEVAQLLAKGVEARRVGGPRDGPEIADARHLGRWRRRLRMRGAAEPEQQRAENRAKTASAHRRIVTNQQGRDEAPHLPVGRVEPWGDSGWKAGVLLHGDDARGDRPAKSLGVHLFASREDAWRFAESEYGGLGRD